MDAKLRIIDCPNCLLFSNPKENIKTKLYYPETIDQVSDSEFVIMDSGDETPMIVLGEHLTEITRECWGRILYRCRKVFGQNVRLRLQNNRISDHWHAYIIKNEY